MTGLNVVPNLKKGKIFLASNYRPLSLTLVTSKILECIYVITFGSTWKIIMSLVIFNMVSASRGIVKPNFMAIHDFVGAMNSKKQVDTLKLDFSKAFDRVPHQRLLY